MGIPPAMQRLTSKGYSAQRVAYDAAVNAVAPKAAAVTAPPQSRTRAATAVGAPHCYAFNESGGTGDVPAGAGSTTVEQDLMSTFFSGLRSVGANELDQAMISRGRELLLHPMMSRNGLSPAPVPISPSYL